MENLEEVWDRLQLNEEENVSIEINLSEESGVKAKRSLVGKIISNRVISKEVVRRTMEKIWRVGKLLEFHEFRANSFIITFANPGDKNRVLGGKPWQFDNCLFVLKPFDGFTQPHKMRFDNEEFWVQMHNLPLACMNKCIGEQIGATIEKVVEVDAGEDGMGWGSFLRIRIECDLNKVVARGRTVNLQGMNMWVPFMYEKLSRMCFRCGRILHPEQGCPGEVVGAVGQFGPWLRASIVKFKKSDESRMRADEEMSGVGN
ncbi:uncharacterized protein LOC121240945 [Juglans microcarpa x Juglans regia]|uniref:uncharacterized protein LOC121240945 n=1 Tax=Juglans microcarpa x Juglans regia TaxID=2249226 RepID=UPI001B7DA063|nr:uncharacterized protein LOC121240945 [Juglans microcarpa x Juglans regia]